MAKSKTNKDKSKAKSNYTKNSKKLSKPDLTSPLEKITDELKAEKEKFLRLFAEFENYKKRTSKERIELFKSANRELMSALIPVIDDFERAKNQTKGIDESGDIKGLYLIFNKMSEILKLNGLSEVEVSVNDTFDSEIHEAITQMPVKNKKQKGKIIDIIEKGFKLGDKIIRFPKVVVGQ
tara:strand:- start:2936 stop:3475 length:540 start_codon:yes stop_codon:yes gene_type:complete